MLGGQPGPGKVPSVLVFHVGEEDCIDGHAEIAKISDDPLGAVVQLRGHDRQLELGVQLVRSGGIEDLGEGLLEGRLEVTVGDFDDAVAVQSAHP